MGGLYSHQRVIRRRYLPHMNTRRSSSTATFSALGGGLRQFFKELFSTIALLFIVLAKKIGGAMNNFFGFIASLFTAKRNKPVKVVKNSTVVLASAGKKTGSSFNVFFSVIAGLLIRLGRKIGGALKVAFNVLSPFFRILGNKLGIVLKKLFTVIGALLIILGTMIGRALKAFFLKLFNVIRYNPLFHKIAATTCLSALAAFAVFMVCFALFASELPPGSLTSSLISETYDNGNFSSVIILSGSSDEHWAAQTAIDDSDFETGAGSQVLDRAKDFEYPVRPGETLSEIAYAYDIPYAFLAWYNKITNANRIRHGTIITIPSYENIEAQQNEYQQHLLRLRQQPQPQPQPAARTVRNITITQESRSSGTGTGITVQFSIVDPPSGLRSYEWDLGDGRRSLHVNPSHEYLNPRTYTVRLTAQDGSGNFYRSNPLYIEIPHPASTAEHSTTKFVTLSSPEEYFVVNGAITRVARYPNIHDVLDLSESDTWLTKARFKMTGYFGLTVKEENGKEQYYSVFVSPIPSMHSDIATTNFNWYRTQFNTGTPSNCGPASAAMAISWGTGRYFPVSSVRQAVGWQGDGGTNFDDLLRVIRNQGVEAGFRPIRSAQSIRDVIDSGSIAIILFLTDGIRRSAGNPATDLFGKYYNDSVGHYIIVKGYSLNGDYFVVHDPIPSDWSGNSFRYGDEISMIGKNRYFPVNQIMNSLRRHDMIVIPSASR